MIKNITIGELYNIAKAVYKIYQYYPQDSIDIQVMIDGNKTYQLQDAVTIMNEKNALSKRIITLYAVSTNEYIEE